MKKRIAITVFCFCLAAALLIYSFRGSGNRFGTTSIRQIPISSQDSGSADLTPNGSGKPLSGADPALFPPLEKHPDYPSDKPYSPAPGFKEHPGDQTD